MPEELTQEERNRILAKFQARQQELAEFNARVLTGEQLAQKYLEISQNLTSMAENISAAE